MKHLTASVLPLVTAACLALAGCGGSTAAATSAVNASAAGASSPAPPKPVASEPSPSSQLETVKMATNVPTANYAPLFVALEKGYFKDVGIRVDYQVLGDPEAAAALLAGGQLDAAIVVPSAALFNGASRGLDTKIVSRMASIPRAGNPAALMVRKDLTDSGVIKSPADLKGRKVALTLGKTGALAYFTHLVLEPFGLSLKDVEVVNLANPDAVGAMKNRAIDATFIPAPFTTQLMQQGTATLLAGAPNIGHSSVATLFGGKLMRERAAVANTVMVALLRGSRDLHGDNVRSDENLAVIAKYTKFPLETVRAMDPYDYDPDLAPDTETILDMQRVYMAEGQLTYTTPLPAERLIEPLFAKYAAEKLGPYRG